MVFDSQSQQILATLKGHTKKVTSVVFHPSQVCFWYSYIFYTNSILLSEQRPVILCYLLADFSEGVYTGRWILKHRIVFHSGHTIGSPSGLLPITVTASCRRPHRCIAGSWGPSAAKYMHHTFSQSLNSDTVSKNIRSSNSVPEWMCTSFTTVWPMNLTSYQ